MNTSSGIGPYATVDNRRDPHPFCPDCGDTGVRDEPIGAFGTHEGVECWCVADEEVSS